MTEAAGDLVDVIAIKSAIQQVEGARRSVHMATIMMLLHRTLARIELNLPPSFQGSFIPAASPFEAIASVSKVLKSADTEFMIVDPYMDANTLTEYCVLAEEGVSIRLLADKEYVRPGFKPTAHSWRAQYGSSRPLLARITPRRMLHDRDIIVDRKIVFSLSQSLNAFAARAHASISKYDPEITALKVSAYEAAWEQAEQLDQ